MNKIFVIGDSFCNDFYWVNPPVGIEKCFWVDDLKNKLPKYEIIQNAQPSRDIQTILDIWIRIINDLNSDDYLLICLPYFRRTRLPLDENNYTEMKIDDKILYNRFVGTASYEQDRELLEFWKNENNSKFYSEKLEYQEMINTSTAYQKTTIEIIESLYKITKSHVYIFSWDDMDIKSEYIEDKNILTNNIGLWETNHDDYVSANGESGQFGDLHWSHKMQKLFSDYIINKFFKPKSSI